ncbi:hypothetical protein FEM48_Zijuj01G0301900 [Ziziphus jujuba var. spinosa]|uniref:CRC domain-containing protein n=1 Tax=Ziziphus jujuba var. spinosa TaxID=714518 RepID=A0A978W5Y0_ZIZJJ|nr:hypothetical protein FEM48_Zijuj01G0301900 [Ziziphus jujuba var. spinosa]
MDHSPEPNRIPTTLSSPSFSSPAVQESPFFNYASNLSPIKSAKATRYAKRFLEINLSTPPPVFTSPRIDMQREDSFPGRDEMVEAGNISKQGGTLSNAVHIPSFEKGFRSCTRLGGIDGYITEPVGVEDSKNSADLGLRPDNEVPQLLTSGFTSPNETITEVEDLDRTAEVRALMLSDQAAENQPSSSLKLVESTVDQRDNGKVKEDISDFTFEKDESDINVDLVSGEQNCGGHGAQEASQHHRGICRHLQFEAAMAYNGTTSTNSNSLCGLTDDTKNVRSPDSLSNLKNLVPFQYEMEASNGQQSVNHVQSMPPQFPSCPFEMLNSSQNCGNAIMSSTIPYGTGFHMNNIGLSDMFANEKLHGHPNSQERLMPDMANALGKDLHSSFSNGVGDVHSHMNNDQPGSQSVMEDNNVPSHTSDHVNPLGNPMHLALIEQHAAPCDGSIYASQDTEMVEESKQLSPKRRRQHVGYQIVQFGIALWITISFRTRNKNLHKATLLDGKIGDDMNCLNINLFLLRPLYCECFAAGVYCVDSCACENCYNKPEFEDTVMDTRQQIESRNPLAFAPRVVKHATDSPANVTEEGNWTPSSARHKRGCNCKKSKCLKKYCECYQAQVGCSDGCRCECCQNSFGKKSETIYKRAEKWDTFSNENIDALKSGVDYIKAETRNANQVAQTWEPLADITNITPLSHTSSGVWDSSSSNFRDYSKVSGVQLRPGIRFQSSAPSSINWNCSPDRLMAQFSDTQASHCLSSNAAFYGLIDNDTPQILKENSTPCKAVKVSSPHQKHESSPQFQSHGLSSGSPPSLRGGRKFILQSMPTFPPLTPYSKSKDKYRTDFEATSD